MLNFGKPKSCGYYILSLNTGTGDIFYVQQKAKSDSWCSFIVDGLQIFEIEKNMASEMIFI